MQSIPLKMINTKEVCTSQQFPLFLLQSIQNNAHAKSLFPKND